MIILRDQQVDAFADERLQSFEDRMFIHVQREFPEEVQELGEIETRELICSGAELAAHYGLESEQGSGQYVLLMFLNGFDFDTSPDTPWAHEVLTDATLAPEEKLEALWEHSLSAADAQDDDSSASHQGARSAFV